ncbi:MAG: energy transducer TonB [Pseudomonadales bacterium]
MKPMYLRWLLLPSLLTVVLACQGSHNRPLQLLSGAGPTYPSVAKEQGIEGEVTVRYAVSVDGSVRNAAVIDAQPPGVFEEAALTAVRSWRYAAPIQNGQVSAVPEVVSVVRFRLNQTPDYLSDE